MSVDFSRIHLTSAERKALHRYSKMDRIPSNDAFLDTFCRLGFVAFTGGEPDGMGGLKNSWFAMSEDGKRYLEYLNQARKDRRIASRRYWITTSIAVLALLIAMLSLLLQVLQAKDLIDLSQLLPR